MASMFIIAVVVFLLVCKLSYTIYLKLIEFIERKNKGNVPFYVRVIAFWLINTPVVWGFSGHMSPMILTPSIIAFPFVVFVDKAIMNHELVGLTFLIMLPLVYAGMKMFDIYIAKSKLKRSDSID